MVAQVGSFKGSADRREFSKGGTVGERKVEVRENMRERKRKRERERDGFE